MKLSRLLPIVLAAALGAWACASGPETGAPYMGFGGDAGMDASMDASSPFAGDVGTQPATNLVFVHGGAPNLSAFRVCLNGAGAPLPSDFSQPMPRANYPGIPVGGAGLLGDVDDNVDLKVTLVDALALADAKGDSRSSMCGDFSFLPPAALETIVPDVLLMRGAVNVAVVQGAASSRTVKVVTLDARPPSPNHLRLQWGQFAQGLGTASASFGPQAAKGTPLGIAGPDTVVASVEVTFDPSSASSAFDTSGITVIGADGMQRFFSLTAIQSATDPTTVPTTFFGSRVSYAVFAIGDATLGDASAGEQLHLVAIPAQL